MPAEIQVRNAIFISGRGAVLIGFVRAGAPRIGQLTAPLVLKGNAERRLEVAAVENLHSAESGGSAVGLVFRNPPELADLRRALPAGSMLALEDGAPPEFDQ
ncbi:MAG: hypothetical protein ABJD11_15575 [Gemmatimonadota bacterium]